jgi:hypothetical protein
LSESLVNNDISKFNFPNSNIENIVGDVDDLTTD